jgi:hypothetical protein
MSHVIQNDLDQEFSFKRDKTAVTETRKVTGTTYTHNHDLDPDGLPSPVSFVGTPQAHQINGTKIQDGGAVETLPQLIKDSRKYNRSIVVALGSTGRDEHRSNVFIFYRVWIPDGDNPTALGDHWLPWNSKDDSFAGKTFLETPLQAGTVTVESPRDREIVITYTSSNRQISYTWTGKWHHSSAINRSPELIEWTGGPDTTGDLAH